jgi:ectoine hydroxylase-related dioxygenase (phytanoyl-CoA dioxygenase family)
VLSKRFARVAATLLDVESVRLYHDQALCKEPGGGRTPWHQDQYYWPLDTDRTITLWMPVVDVPADVGSMTFASGSHRLGDLRGRATATSRTRSSPR